MILKLLQDSNLDHDYDEKARIEAALYSSGRSLSPRELAKAAGITSSRRAIIHARLLVQKSKECLDAVEIIEHAKLARSLHISFISKFTAIKHD